MSQENIEKKDTILMEYERIIRELTYENETLKKRVSELEEENRIFKGSRRPIREIPKPEFKYGTKTPILEQEVVFASSVISQGRVTLEMGKGPIVEGISRRECPICGNTTMSRRGKRGSVFVISSSLYFPRLHLPGHTLGPPWRS